MRDLDVRGRTWNHPDSVASPSNHGGFISAGETRSRSALQRTPEYPGGKYLGCLNGIQLLARRSRDYKATPRNSLDGLGRWESGHCATVLCGRLDDTPHGFKIAEGTDPIVYHDQIGLGGYLRDTTAHRFLPGRPAARVFDRESPGAAQHLLCAPDVGGGESNDHLDDIVKGSDAFESTKEYGLACQAEELLRKPTPDSSARPSRRQDNRHFGVDDGRWTVDEWTPWFHGATR